MENFENSLDLSIFDEMDEKKALSYIEGKFWEKALNEVKKHIKWRINNLTENKWVD
jgi:hypothetical protein